MNNLDTLWKILDITEDSLSTQTIVKMLGVLFIRHKEDFDVVKAIDALDDLSETAHSMADQLREQIGGN